MDKKRNWNIVKLLLKLIFTAAALWFVYKKIDVKALADIWKDANPWLFIPAIACFIISQFFSSFRLLNYFKNIELPISVTSNIRLYIQGMFYNIFLPGGIGGDGYKVLALHRRTRIPRKVIFSAVFFDRLSGLWALSFLILVLSTVVGILGENIYLAWIGFIAATIAYYFIVRLYFPKHCVRFAATHGLAIVVQTFQVLCAAAIMMALGHEGDKMPYLFIFLLSSFATLFPFSVGGLGAREIVIVWGAGMLHLDKDISVAISLCFYVISALVSIAGGFILFEKKQPEAPVAGIVS